MPKRKRWLIYGVVTCGIVVGQVAFFTTIISPHPDIGQAPVETNRVTLRPGSRS